MESLQSELDSRPPERYFCNSVISKLRDDWRNKIWESPRDIPSTKADLRTELGRLDDIMPKGNKGSGAGKAGQGSQKRSADETPSSGQSQKRSRKKPNRFGNYFQNASDASFADDIQSRKSTEGYQFKFFGGALDWKSRKQQIVVTSTTEAELLSLQHAAKEIHGWHHLFRDIESMQNNRIIMLNAITIKP